MASDMEGSNSTTWASGVEVPTQEQGQDIFEANSRKMNLKPDVNDPFATPIPSAPATRPPSVTNSPLPAQRRYFHSRRVKKGTVERPWLHKKDPREKWVTIIPVIGMFVGLVVTGILVWDGLRSVVNHKYCPVLMEDFSNGIDPKIWTQEAEVGGFGYDAYYPQRLLANIRKATASSRKRLRPTRTSSLRTPCSSSSPLSAMSLSSRTIRPTSTSSRMALARH